MIQPLAVAAPLPGLTQALGDLMQCFAITKGQKRCQKDAAFLYCSAHRQHPLILGFMALTFIGLVSGIFRDLIEPLLPTKSASAITSNEPAEEASEIRIPIDLESTWDTDTTLNPAAQIFLTRPSSENRDEVLYSAAARFEVPEDGATINGEIWVPSNRTTRTNIILPRSKVLSHALANGGSNLRITLKNKHGHTFTHTKSILFDEQSVSTPVRFWLRLDFEQIP